MCVVKCGPQCGGIAGADGRVDAGEAQGHPGPCWLVGDLRLHAAIMEAEFSDGAGLTRETAAWRCCGPDGAPGSVPARQRRVLALRSRRLSPPA